jgi:NAD(P)-dependent dehydrogenase (short-subunit alcohol dehydrogenase family)
MRLQNRVAYITGGGSGIGAACAQPVDGGYLAV